MKKNSSKENIQTIPQDDIVEINPEDIVNENNNQPDTDILKNWDFFNQLHTVKPYTSHDGNRFTPSYAKQIKKRKKKNKSQRNSRRINRN